MDKEHVRPGMLCFDQPLKYVLPFDTEKILQTLVQQTHTCMLNPIIGVLP